MFYFRILSLGERLDISHCNALEEVLKRVRFKTIDLEATDLDDDVSDVSLRLWQSNESIVIIFR